MHIYITAKLCKIRNAWKLSPFTWLLVSRDSSYRIIYLFLAHGELTLSTYTCPPGDHQDHPFQADLLHIPTAETANSDSRTSNEPLPFGLVNFVSLLDRSLSYRRHNSIGTIVLSGALCLVNAAPSPKVLVRVKTWTINPPQETCLWPPSPGQFFTRLA